MCFEWYTLAVQSGAPKLPNIPQSVFLSLSSITRLKEIEPNALLIKLTLVFVL
jgi:hypothetical protein